MALTSRCLSFLIWELASNNSSLRELNELTRVSGKDQNLAVSKRSPLVIAVKDQSTGELRGCVLSNVRKVVNIRLIVKE